MPVQCVAADRDGRVLAGTRGEAALLSVDGGESWERVELPEADIFAVAIGAADGALYAGSDDDPDRWYASAATGPPAAHAGDDARGRLYRWDGDAWSPLPLPSDAMPYALAFAAGELLAGMSDGQILRSHDHGDSWDQIATGLGSILAMATA